MGKSSRLTLGGKYLLYEHSVQQPSFELDLYEAIYREHYGKEALVLREDFCGTFWAATEWIKRGQGKQAICIDIDPVPLEYGKKRHLASLTSQEKKRLRVKKQDVRCVTSPKANIIVAGNFSFYVLTKREDLLCYLKACRRSLKSDGLLLLDMAGGSFFEDAPRVEQRSYRHQSGAKRDRPWFTYYWRHKAYNPLNSIGEYAIDFRLSGGVVYKNAFTYHWRVWSPIEVRECLEEAGFSSIHIYWQANNGSADNPLASYRRVDKIPNDPQWLCYLAALP